MGVCLGLMFDTEVQNTGAFEECIADGKDFVYEMDWLDSICDRLGIPPISRFCPDDDELEAAYQATPKGKKFEGIWFDPADGLKVVNRLTKALNLEREETTGQRKKRKLDLWIVTLAALESDLKKARGKNLDSRSSTTSESQRRITIDCNRAADRVGPDGKPFWPPPVESCRSSQKAASV